MATSVVSNSVSGRVSQIPVIFIVALRIRAAGMRIMIPLSNVTSWARNGWLTEIRYMIVMILKLAKMGAIK